LSFVWFQFCRSCFWSSFRRKRVIRKNSLNGRHSRSGFGNGLTADFDSNFVSSSTRIWLEI
jgi:hypothetical protein